MWEDNNDEEFGEEHNKDYFHKLRETEKEMLKIDLVRGAVMPMSISEWTELFGTPTEEDLADITQAYLKQYHQHGDEYITLLIDAFGVKWISYLLQFNEMLEEYELCSIIKSHLDIYNKENIQHGNI